MSSTQKSATKNPRMRGPPGFGQRQSSGAWDFSTPQAKRQRAAAVQDAVARAYIPFGSWSQYAPILASGLSMNRDLVAQVSNLLYRRLPVGRPCTIPAPRYCSPACGLEIRDTADWKSALQGSWSQCTTIGWDWGLSMNRKAGRVCPRPVSPGPQSPVDLPATVRYSPPEPNSRGGFPQSPFDSAIDSGWPSITVFLYSI